MTERRVSMRWQVRQVMASRGIFQTSDLVPLLADRGVHLTRQYVHRLVTTTPQRINTDILAALCDILACTPADLLETVVEQSEPAAAAGQQSTGRRSTREGLGVGELRPVRATVRKPPTGG